MKINNKVRILVLIAVIYTVFGFIDVGYARYSSNNPKISTRGFSF